MGLETAALIGSIGASVIGGAASVAGGIMNYNQQNQQADAQEKAFEAEQQNAQNIAEYNAKLAERQAQETEAEAAEREKRARIEGERRLATQRAFYGKSGAALSTGSPLAVLGETAVNNEMTALEVRREGVIAANDLRSQGQMYEYQGAVSGSKSFYRPSYAGSLLSGVAGGVAGLGQAAGTYANYAYKPDVPKTKTNPMDSIYATRLR